LGTTEKARRKGGRRVCIAIVRWRRERRGKVKERICFEGG